MFYRLHRLIFSWTPLLNADLTESLVAWPYSTGTVELYTYTTVFSWRWISMDISMDIMLAHFSIKLNTYSMNEQESEQ